MSDDEMMLARSHHRVTMADVDAARVIYFSSPLRWQEELFSGWLHEHGRSLSAQFAAGHASPVVHTSVDYLFPLGLDDEVELELVTITVGRSSFGLRMQARTVRGGEPAVCVYTDHVYVALPQQPGTRLQARPLPSWLRSLLAGQQNPGPPVGKKGSLDE